MESQHIKKKSIAGAKYAVLSSLLSIPLTYGINVILGRISPEALGTYGLVLVFIAVITTFILFGGNTLVIKMLPEIKDDKKIPFLLTYLALTLFIAFIFIIFILFFPGVFKLITQINLTSMVFKFFILFIPVVIIQQIILYALNGMMEIKTSVLLEKLIPAGTFLFFLSLSIFYKEFIITNYEILIWVTYISLILISAILGGMLLIQRLKQKYRFNKVEFFIPNNFWPFALFVHASTLLFFFYDKVDNLFMVNYFSVSELGYYVAALQTAMLVTLIPSLLGRVMLPAFSNLLAANDTYLIRKGYEAIVKYIVIISVPIALFLMFFSKQVMGIFGASYITRSTPLVILSACFGLASMGQINSSLVMLKNKMGLYLLNSIIQISIQIILILLLIRTHEAVGVSIARAVGLLIAQIGLGLIVFKKLNLRLRFPKSYIGSVISLIVALSICFLFPGRNISVSSLSFIFSVLIVVIIGNYGVEDMLFFKKHFFHKGDF